MATGGHEAASDEIPDFQCVSCDNRTVEKYCVECQGYCCRSCVGIHSRFPVMRGHTLLDKSNFHQGAGSSGKQRGGASGKLPIVPTERCDVHTIKLLDMYCADHDEVGCTTCMALKHRSCENIHSIPDDIDILFKPAEISEVCRNLQVSRGVLENVSQKKQSLLEELEASKEKADTTIKEARNKIVEAANEIERKSLEKINNVYQTMKTKIEDDRKSALEQFDGMQNISENINASRGNIAQQFICMKVANKKIKEVKDSEPTLRKQSKAKLSFSVNPDIHVYLGNMKSLGTIETETTVEKTEAYTVERTEAYTVQKFSDMNVKLPEDSSVCHIPVSCLTEDANSLLLLDHNNKKLKRVDMKTKSIDGYCKFDHNPYCVCCTDKQEAVVTFYRSTDFIQFVSLSHQLKPTRQVKIGHHCLGITYKDDKLYITDAGKNVYIHDMAGNQLQTVSRDTSGNDLFSCIQRIVFNDDGNRVFVADWNKGVVILDGQWKHVASYSFSGLNNATAVCTDRRGNIFVCGFGSHNVLQIGYDGKKRGVIASRSDGLNGPLSVCFDTSQCQLIATQHTTDIVKIFHMK